MPAYVVCLRRPTIRYPFSTEHLAERSQTSIVVDFALAPHVIVPTLQRTIRRAQSMPLTISSPAAMVGARSTCRTTGDPLLSSDEVAILTELIFEHSLRVRFTAESVNDEKADSQQDRDNETIVDSGDNSSEAHGPAVSGTDSESTATTSTAGKGKSKTVAPSASSATSSTVNLTAPPTKSPKKDINLVGKINNFVTTDLNNIIRSKDFFFLRTCLRLTELPFHESSYHLPPQL